MVGNTCLKKSVQIKVVEMKSDIPSQMLSEDLSVNEKSLKEIFRNCTDVIFRPIGLNDNKHLLLIYVDGLCDTKTLEEVVLKPLLEGILQDVRFVIDERLIAVAQVQMASCLNDLVDHVLKGDAAILVDGENQAIIADLKGFDKRGIEEPTTESTVRGPRDGFTETLRTNTMLIRRRIRSSKLKMETYSVGKFSKTDIVIAYIEGIVQDVVLEEVRKRIKRIQIDGVVDSGYIEDFIEDLPYSPFPQVQNTERPDIACAGLLEGKVAIIIDNTPFTLLVPMTFWAGLQASEDYYERFIYTTFVRWLRYLLLNIALFLPSLYVATTTFHPQLIPTNLLISIAAARDGVPFPAAVEALMMEFMFEGLREAGIRLPKPIGSAVSIVGALVIGQAAVEAGIISAPMVIVVATTGIASFAIPRYNLGTAYRLLRFPMLILGGTLGLFGIMIGAVCILIHLVCLSSFGVPYMSPLAPQIPANMKDVLIRAPRRSLQYRPSLVSGRNKKRIPENQKPGSGTEE